MPSNAPARARDFTWVVPTVDKRLARFCAEPNCHVVTKVRGCGAVDEGSGDRVGLSWRREFAAGIVQQLEHIDVVEVIADDYFDAPARRARALDAGRALGQVALR